MFGIKMLNCNSCSNNKGSRDVWLKKTLRQLNKGMRILDAGAGELQYRGFCDHLEYVSQDFGQYNGKGDNHGLQTQSWDNTKVDIISDIANIPVPENSFDAIMCVEVLEHIPEPILAIKEFSRILRPGGTLILTAPVCSLTHFAPYYYYNGFSKYFYEKFLPEHGFNIDELSYNGNWFKYIGQELNRLVYVLNEYCDCFYIYKSKVFSTLMNLFFLPLFIFLGKASECDMGSNDIMSFGIHVKATKI